MLERLSKIERRVENVKETCSLIMVEQINTNEKVQVMQKDVKALLLKKVKEQNQTTNYAKAVSSAASTRPEESSRPTQNTQPVIQKPVIQKQKTGKRLKNLKKKGSSRD